MWWKTQLWHRAAAASLDAGSALSSGQLPRRTAQNAGTRCSKKKKIEITGMGEIVNVLKDTIS